MIRLVTLALLCSASVVCADRYVHTPGLSTVEPWYSEPAADADHDGTVTVFNGKTHGNGGNTSVQTFTIETPMGPFTIEQLSTRNDHCSPECPDTFTIIDWPEGFMPSEFEFIVPEKGHYTIMIRKFRGL